MSTRRMQITTTRTGRKRIVKIAVYDTEAEMQKAATRATLAWGFPAGQDFSIAGAACTFPYEWDDDDEREHLVTILLSREQLDLTTIMHEVVHAACFLYMVDLTTSNSRARRHVNGWNELLAYLASELYSALIYKFDIIPIDTTDTAGMEIPA